MWIRPWGLAPFSNECGTGLDEGGLAWRRRGVHHVGVTRLNFVLRDGCTFSSRCCMLGGGGAACWLPEQRAALLW